MLIIFDLDDTLVDTSLCITPIKLKSALVRMREAGCLFSSFDDSLEILLNLNKKASSSKEALLEFVKITGIKEEFLQIGVDEVYNTDIDNILIPPSEGAIELLIELKQDNYLAIVSMGSPQRQISKLKKAGIDSALFYKISILEKGSKRNLYQDLMTELGFSPLDVLVCGDRIQVDLSPAKELGCRTVHVKKGRGLSSQGREGDVDFTVSHLSQVLGIYLGIRQSINKRHNGK